MEANILNKNCILIVDDDFINRELLKNIFSSQFIFEEAENGKEGLRKIKKHKDKLCAIILDVEMPEMTGIELLEKISDIGITDMIPTFLITAHDDDELVENAYRLGVMDVVSKPVGAVVVERRVKTVIELFSARERLRETVKGQEIKLSENAKVIDELHRGTLETLATAIEFRDMESGQHVSRIYGMTKYILMHTDFGKGLSEDVIESMARASIMHDVGKIAISDVILNKPGKLTKEEFEIMKQHTVRGAELMQQIAGIQSHDSYTFAVDVARHHHERWDGRGYPDGLKGDEISVAAQVVSIVDVYDALVSARVYKAPFSHDEAVNMIKNGECGVFNPKMVDCFLEAEPVIRKWYLADDTDEVLKELIETGNESNLEHNEDGKAPDSVNDIMLLMTAVQYAYDAISAVNLTKNTFRIIGIDKMGIHSAERTGKYDDIIDVGCKHIPLSHRREFRETFNRESLIRTFYEGKKSVRMEYPQNADDGSVRWLSTKVLLMQDSRTGDIVQITLMQFIDDKYKSREKTRKALANAQTLVEQSANAKSDILSKIRRDINSPLNDIIKIAAVAEENIQDTEKTIESLTRIKMSSKYLLDTVNKDDNY